MKKFILCLLFVSCTSAPEPVNIQPNETDSIVIKSRETVVTSVQASQEADKSINKKVNSVAKEINTLKSENKELAKSLSVKTVIRDTVYITEKKNFWGKSKKTVDSSKGVTVDSIKN